MRCITLAVLAALAPAALAQTSYPMITHVQPVAVQRGKTSNITIEGQMNFWGAYKALFEGAGLSTELPPAPAPMPVAQRPQVKSVACKLAVAPAAALGVREFRLATPLGISSVGQLLIVDDPVVVESGNNNTLGTANPVPVPSVVCGRIEAAEDVDFFKFHAEAGQVLTFEVQCARLQDKIHDLQKHADPLLAVFNAEGRELASSDDFCFADPLLTFKVPATGDYFVQVRDAKFDGDPRWVYALSITHRPYATHVYPFAGQPGQVLDVEPVGSAQVSHPRVKVRVPTEPGIHEAAVDLGGTSGNPVAVISSSLPQVVEIEPNDTQAQAQRVTVPCGISGRIANRRDVDHFVLKATKNKTLRLEVKARRFATPLRSSLDAVIDVLDAKGTVVTSGDDTYGKDPAVQFTPPADGDYTVRVRDLNNKGAATAVYYLEIEEALPDITAKCDPDKAFLGPGSSMAFYVQVARINGFTGPITIEARGLPKGVNASPLTIPANMTTGVLALTAAADAPRDAGAFRLVATAKLKDAAGKETTLERPVQAQEEIYSPGGGRAVFGVNGYAVAVTELPDILKVDVLPATVTLKPGGEVRLEVAVQRRPDFTQGVSLDAILRHLGSVFGNPLPPGVTIDEGKSKTLLGNGSKGHIVLKAAANAAPCDKVPICVLANVSVNFVVKVSYASTPVLLSVVKP
jgi:hypothetical protein